MYVGFTVPVRTVNRKSTSGGGGFALVCSQPALAAITRIQIIIIIRVQRIDTHKRHRNFYPSDQLLKLALSYSLGACIVYIYLSMFVYRVFEYCHSLQNIKVYLDLGQ